MKQMTTAMVRLEARWDDTNGTTILYDGYTGTPLFTATEAASEYLDNVTEFGIQVAMAVKNDLLVNLLVEEEELYGQETDDFAHVDDDGYSLLPPWWRQTDYDMKVGDDV